MHWILRYFFFSGFCFGTAMIVDIVFMLKCRQIIATGLRFVTGVVSLANHGKV